MSSSSMTNQVRVCGRKRISAGHQTKKSSTRSQPGRSRSQRKAKKCKKTAKKTARTKVNCSQSSNKSVYSNCLKKEIEKRKLRESRYVFVKDRKASFEAAVRTHIPGKSLKPDARKFGKKWDSKRLYEERQNKRQEALDKQVERSREAKERDLKSRNADGSKVMYCLFMVLRQILDLSPDPNTWWGMNQLFFPGHLKNLREAVDHVFQTGYGERFVSQTKNCQIFFMVSSFNPEENHVSLNWFPGCTNMNFFDFYTCFWNTPFFASDDESSVPDDIFHHDNLGLKEDEITQVAAMIANLIWLESHKIAPKSDEPEFELMSKISSEDSFMIAKKMYYDVIGYFKFKPQFLQVNRAGLDFSVLEFSLVLTSYCRSQILSRPLSQLGFDAVSEQISNILMAMVLGMAKEGKKMSSIVLQPKLLVEAKSKKALFRSETEFLLPFFRVKEPFGHLGPATWKRFYLGRVQTAAIGFNVNKLASYMTPPSSWDLEKAKTFMPPPARRELYKNKSCYRPLPSIFESDESDSGENDSVTTSIEDQHNSEEPINPFTLLKENTESEAQVVSFEHLEVLFSRLKEGEAEDSKRNELSLDDWAAAAMDVVLPDSPSSLSTVKKDSTEVQPESFESPKANNENEEPSGLYDSDGRSSFGEMETGGGGYGSEEEIDWTANQGEDSEEEDIMGKMSKFQFTTEEDAVYIPKNLRDKDEELEEIGDTFVRRPSLLLENSEFDDHVSQEQKRIPEENAAKIDKFMVQPSGSEREEMILDPDTLEGSCGFDCAPVGFKSQRKWIKFFGEERFKKGWFSSSELAAFYDSFDTVFAVLNPDGSYQFPGFGSEDETKRTAVCYKFSGEMDQGHWFGSYLKEFQFNRKCDHGDKFKCPHDCQCQCKSTRCKNRRTKASYLAEEFYLTQESFDNELTKMTLREESVETDKPSVSDGADLENSNDRPDDETLGPHSDEETHKIVFVPQLAASISLIPLKIVEGGQMQLKPVQVSSAKDSKYKTVLMRFYERVKSLSINYNKNLVNQKCICKFCSSKATNASWTAPHSSFVLTLFCNDCFVTYFSVNEIFKLELLVHSTMSIGYYGTNVLRKKVLYSNFEGQTLNFDLEVPIWDSLSNVCILCCAVWLPYESQSNLCEHCDRLVKPFGSCKEKVLQSVFTGFGIDFGEKKLFIDTLDKAEVVEMRSRFENSSPKISPEGPECFLCKDICHFCFGFNSSEMKPKFLYACDKCSIVLITKLIMVDILSIDLVTNSSPDWFKLSHIERIWPPTKNIVYVNDHNEIVLSSITRDSPTAPGSYNEYHTTAGGNESAASEMDDEVSAPLSPLEESSKPEVFEEDWMNPTGSLINYLSPGQDIKGVLETVSEEQSEPHFDPKGDDQEVFVSYFSLENLMKAFPRGPVSSPPSIAIESQLKPKEPFKISDCMAKVLSPSEKQMASSNTVSQLYYLKSEPSKIMFFRFGKNADDKMNHVSETWFAGSEPLRLADLASSSKVSWNLYSEDSIRDDQSTLDSNKIDSDADSNTNEDDWLNFVNVASLDEQEIKTSSALILQFIEIETSKEHFRVLGKIEEAMFEVSRLIQHADAVTSATITNFYVAMFLTTHYGLVSSKRLLQDGKLKFSAQSMEVVENMMHTLTVAFAGTHHEANLTDLSIQLYEEGTDENRAEELDILSVMSGTDQQKELRMKLGANSPFSSVRKAIEKSSVNNQEDYNWVILDTNLLVWLHESSLLATLPFELICLKPVFNEIVRLTKNSNESDKQPLLKHFMDLLRVNRFMMHSSGNDSGIGDDLILEEAASLRQLHPLLLSGDRDMVDRASSSGISAQLLNRNSWLSFVKSLSSLPMVISLDWITCFGLKTVLVDKDGQIFSDSGRDIKFFNIEANSLNNLRKLPNLSRLNDIIFDKESYEDLFLGYRDSAYSAQILKENEVEEALNSYDESLINEAKKCDPIFKATRGDDIKRIVSDIDEASVFAAQLFKAKTAFEASCKLRNKSLPEFIDCYKFPQETRDSCWPSQLSRVEESHQSISEVFLNTVPGFSRISRKSDLPSWAQKFDANPIKVKRWLENSSRTLKNSGYIQMEGFKSKEKFKYQLSSDADEKLFDHFDTYLRKAEVVGDSPPMDQIREAMFYDNTQVLDCDVIQRYSWLLNHLIHDVVNISISTGRVYINDNNLINVSYMLGPGARNRTIMSKRGVRFCFITESKSSFKGFYPEFDLPLRNSKGELVPGKRMLISRYYYLGIEDLIWKSRLWTNFTLPRLKGENSVTVIGLYWSMFHASSNVKKLLSFFKYFNVVSLSTYSKLDGLIEKYLQILPKRESEIWLWRKVISTLKSVILEDKPITILGEASDLPDYLERNNLYTMPRPQTTSSTHDYQMMYRDIKSNIAMRESVSLRKLFSREYSDKKHINVACWQNSVRTYAKHFPYFSSEELSACLSKDFLPFFVTNSNGVDPDQWRKTKNAIIFNRVLKKFDESTPDSFKIDNTKLVPHFISFCLNRLEERGPFAFISIKPQKDAADREIVVQDFYTKAGHFALQAIFKHLSSKWEGELVSKSTYDKYSFISRMKFDEKTFFINDDMAKWSPQDLNEKFEFLINLLDHYAVLPPEMIGLLVRSFRLTKNVVLLFDERLRDPSLNWYRPEDLLGKYSDGVLSSAVKNRGFRNYKERMESNLNKESLFSPLVMSFGWPQGLKHFISSFAHGLATIYTERVITKVLGFGTLVQSGFHSDDKNTAVTLLKTDLKDLSNLQVILNLSDKSVRPFCLGQSKTKSSVSVFPTHLKFKNHQRARKVSELVSVYNVEGTILDSYFRQSSNLTAGFTFPTFVENHYSLVTRCCSIFNLSNRVIEPEVIYFEILKYLELFFGQTRANSASTLSYGARKKVPIYLLAEYGFAADNVWSVLENFDGAMSELRDYLVIRSMKSLSASGKAFKEKVERTVNLASQLDKKASRSLFATESVRLTKPVAGVFSKDKDESLNNLFRFKNEPLYVNWSSFKKSLFRGDPDSEKAQYSSLNDVVTKVQSNLPETAYVDETVAATESVYLEILSRLLDNYEPELKSEPDISGIMTRKSVKSEMSLSNDFTECQFLIEHGMKAMNSFRLRIKWNSLIDDIEKFVATHNVRTVEEFRSLNSIWDQIKKSSVDRNPVFLLYKGKTDFTDLKMKLVQKRFDQATRVFSEKDDSEPVVIKNWVKSRLTLKKTSEFRARNFDNIVTFNLNKMVFDSDLKLPCSISVTETKWVRELKNELFDKPGQLKCYSRIAKSLKSFITGEMEEFKKNEIVLVAAEYEGTPDSAFYYECVGNPNTYFLKTRTGIFANLECSEESLQIARKHFRSMPQMSDQLTHIMNTRLADKKFRMGYVRSIAVTINEKGFLSASVISSTGALSGRVTSFPLLLRSSGLPNDPFESKMRSVELGINSVLVHEFKSSSFVDESPDQMFESISSLDYERVAHKVNKALGTVQQSFNLRFCDFNENIIGTFNHSECGKNSGDIVYCMKDQKFNKFFSARMKALSSDIMSDFKKVYLEDNEEISDQLKIFKKRNLMSYCHKISHLPGGDYLNYIAYKSSKLSKKTMNWVTNLLNGRGFILMNKENKGFLGFSWELISALAKAKHIDISSVTEIRNNDLIEAILPSHAHQPLNFVSNLQHACRISSQLKKWLESNKEALQPEVKFASIVDDITAKGFRIQNDEIMKLTDPNSDYGLNYVKKIVEHLDQETSREFLEKQSEIESLRGGSRNKAIKELRHWCCSLLSSSPELQLDYQMIGRKFSDSEESKLAVVDLDSNIIIFRQLPGLQADVDLEIPLVEQLRPVKSGNVPLTFNYSNYAEFASTFDPADLVDLWKEKIDHFLEHDEVGFEMISKQLKSIVAVEKTFDADHLEDTSYHSYGFSKESARYIAKMVLESKSVFLPEYESYHKISVITKQEQFSSYFALNPIEFDETFAQSSSSNISVLSKAVKRLDETLIDEILKNSLIGQITACRLKNGEDAADVSSDLMETDFSKLITGLRAMNPGSAKKTVRITDTGFKSSSKVWVYEKSSLAELLVSFGTMKEKEDLIMLWSLLKRKPSKTDHEIALLNSASLAASLAPDLLTNNRLKTVFGNPLNWKRHIERIDAFWASERGTEEEKERGRLLNPDLKELISKLSL
uniref:RNA-directed RNA polymerase L n=1 Tax=Rhizoctonia cerealis bunyavirus TaxID=3068840 RepID=A0AA51GK87_9VIRU|nr:MAG: RNA-dependent RNA polymerase [Rhizoctonia cerealis bunyavirus]